MLEQRRQNIEEHEKARMKIKNESREERKL